MLLALANLKTPALKRYTNSLMLEMGKYLKQTADALERFAKDGERACRSPAQRVFGVTFILSKE